MQDFLEGLQEVEVKTMKQVLRIGFFVIAALGIAQASFSEELGADSASNEQAVVRANYNPVSAQQVQELPGEENRTSKILYNVAERILGDAPVAIEHTPRAEDRERKGTHLIFQVMHLTF